MVKPDNLWVIAFVLLFLLLGMQKYWNDKLKNSKGEKTLTWDDAYLMVKAKDQIIKQIPTTSILSISLPSDMWLPMESMKEMIKEVSNQSKFNYLGIKTQEENHKFEFDLDSYYMIV